MEQRTTEQAEERYYAASAKVEALFKTLTPQQVRNLMQQYLVGVFDVGIAEALSTEQIEGVTMWLTDLALSAEHMDLDQSIEPGEPVDWR